MADTTHTPPTLGVPTAGVRRAPHTTSAPVHRRLRARLAGGIDGNERLTGLTGVLLIVLFAALGVTILRMGQLLWLHLFLGLTLGGPIALKLASAGYRFTQYYLGDRPYVRKGPPATALRMLAPVLVLCTLGVLATGLVLLLLGPSARQPVLLLHKLFFFAWLAVCGIHVLAHLPDLARLRRTRSATFASAGTGAGPAGTSPRVAAVPGSRARGMALTVSLLAGLALAISLTGLFHVWTG